MSGAEEDEQTTLLWISAWGYLIWIGVGWIGDRGRGGNWGTTQQINPTQQINLEVHACGCGSLGGRGRRAMRGGGRGAGWGLGGKVGRGQRTTEGADRAGIKRTALERSGRMELEEARGPPAAGTGRGADRMRD
jgi:hypothetical protein